MVCNKNNKRLSRYRRQWAFEITSLLRDASSRILSLAAVVALPLASSAFGQGPEWNRYTNSAPPMGGTNAYGQGVQGVPNPSNPVGSAPTPGNPDLYRGPMGVSGGPIVPGNPSALGQPGIVGGPVTSYQVPYPQPTYPANPPVGNFNTPSIPYDPSFASPSDRPAPFANPNAPTNPNFPTIDQPWRFNTNPGFPPSPSTGYQPNVRRHRSTCMSRKRRQGVSSSVVR